MKKLVPALISVILFSGNAYANKSQTIIENNALRYFGRSTLTEEASDSFLKKSAFEIDRDTFKQDSTIIHNKITFDGVSGPPIFFAFNEGRKAVGIAAALDENNQDFFKRMSALSNISCLTLKSSYDNLKVCYHTSARVNTIKKFNKDFKYLMENSN